MRCFLIDLHIKGEELFEEARVLVLPDDAVKKEEE